ncbi:ankyrin repeat-containing domain protein [Mycena galopus ATCC 62051]|nr:ankyrin repeat-containing domain protein [Mycena galopus ATCC 62051]
MSTRRAYFDDLPPELILLLSPSLSTASLNALATTSQRFHQILQPDLESCITPDKGQELLLWAAASKPHVVAKLLSLPYSIPPSPDNRHYFNPTALHVAVKAGNIEIAQMLLNKGAATGAEWTQDEYHPLHLAVQGKDLEMVRLLLDRGARIDTRFGYDGRNEDALKHACWTGQLDMVKLLLERGS